CPPQEQGKPLAKFSRGAGVEFRVNDAEYQGNRFISLRVWERDQSGQWWPAKGKGCSIRIGECEELAEVLAAVVPGKAREDRSKAPEHIGDELGEDRPRYV